jgi:threonine aldolase
MANQVSLKAHTQAGDEVVAHPQAHIVRAESAGGAAISGVHFRTVGNPDGTMAPQQVLDVYQAGDDPHYAPTRLVCLENTHNACGGKAIGLAEIEAVARVAREKGLALHLDGARLLNACIALDVKPERMAAPFDSLTLCFSKGLGAPVGSIIAGRRDFIVRCARFRKMFGGGTRQAGILAEAARHALAHHVERLAEDHANARRLAEGLRETGKVELPYGLPETNIVFFRSTHPRVTQDRLLDALKTEGILIGRSKGGTSRIVTHLDVDAHDIERTLRVARRALTAG